MSKVVLRNNIKALAFQNSDQIQASFLASTAFVPLVASKEFVQYASVIVLLAIAFRLVVGFIYNNISKPVDIVKHMLFFNILYALSAGGFLFYLTVVKLPLLALIFFALYQSVMSINGLLRDYYAQANVAVSEIHEYNRSRINTINASIIVGSVLLIVCNSVLHSFVLGYLALAVVALIRLSLDVYLYLTYPCVVLLRAEPKKEVTSLAAKKETRVYHYLIGIKITNWLGGSVFATIALRCIELKLGYMLPVVSLLIFGAAFVWGKAIKTTTDRQTVVNNVIGYVLIISALGLFAVHGNALTLVLLCLVMGLRSNTASLLDTNTLMKLYKSTYTQKYTVLSVVSGVCGAVAVVVLKSVAVQTLLLLSALGFVLSLLFVVLLGVHTKLVFIRKQPPVVEAVQLELGYCETV